MVIVVIIVNLLITLVNLSLAWRIWKLRLVLIRVRKTLTLVERRVDRVLAPAPEIIAKGKIGTRNLKQSHQRLVLQLQQANQILTLIGLGYSICQGRSKSRIGVQK
jgi:hypothetical protein